MPSPTSGVSAEQRRQEIENKKKKLAMLREQKKRVEEDRVRQLTQQDGPAQNGSRVTLSSDDFARILEEVGVESEPHLSTPRVNGRASSPAGGVTDSPPESSAPLVNSQRVMTSSRVLNLELTDPSTVTIALKEGASYCKTTQTDDERFSVAEFSTGSQEFDYDEDMLPLDKHVEYHGFDGSPSEELKDILPYFRQQPEQAASTAQEERKENTTAPRPPDLSEEEKTQILSSQRFHVFFDKAARVVERALAEELDIFKDYSANRTQEKVVSSDILVLSRVFVDEKWSAGRCVTGLDFSGDHPELVAVAYDQNPDAPAEPSGVVLVWNTKFKKPSPEYTFQSQARLTSVAFAKFHPNLILAGCYSGQICMWDNRASKRTPVNKSPLSTNAHTHPVYAMSVVGSHNAHNLVSVSTDGRFCSWNVDNLTVPIDTKELMAKQKQIPVLCMAFPENEVNLFVVGGEDGNVYLLSRHVAANAQNIVQQQYIDGHTAPVSGASFHRASGIIDLSHLFLTASFDWTIKLWSTKEQKAKISFEAHSAYVVDVAWSPVHPAVFVSIDAEGNLFIWNINEDIEGPVAKFRVGEGDSPTPTLLRKAQWAENGQHIIVGDEAGKLWFYDVHESLYSIRSEEWTKLTRTLAEITQASEEAEKLSESMRSISTGSNSTTPSSVLAAVNVSPRGNNWP